MKNLGKAAFILIAVISIAVFVLGMFGITTYYGDISTTVVDSAKDINYGLDSTGGVRLVLSPSDDSVQLTKEEMNSLKSVLEKRLATYVVDEYMVNCNYETNEISVLLTYAEDSQYSLSWVIEQLTKVGKVGLYEGQAVDESKLILTDEQINSATVSADVASNYYIFGVKLNLNAEGKAIYREASQRLFDEYEENDFYSQVMLAIDGEPVSTSSVKGVVKNGVADIRSYSLSSTDAGVAAAIVDSGKLLTELKCVSYTGVSSFMGDYSVVALGLAFISAAVLIYIYMINKYKLCGVASLVTMFGTVGGILFASAGMFESDTAQSIPYTMMTYVALFVIFILSLEANIRYFNKLKSNLVGSTTSVAASNAFNKTIGGTLMIALSVVLVGVVLLAFTRGSTVADRVLAPIFGAFNIRTVNYISFANFGSAIIAGTISSLIFSVFGTKFMVDSFAKYNNQLLLGGDLK